MPTPAGRSLRAPLATLLSVIATVAAAACGGGGSISTTTTSGSASSAGAGGEAAGSASSSSAGGASATSSTTSTTSATTGTGGAPAPTFLDVYPLAAQYPEGGIYEPTDNVFYVGSLGDGTVHRVDAATGDETVIFTETAPGTWWTLGMDVDVVRRRLWVCAMDDRSPSPRAGRVWIFDLDTQQRVADHDLADAATDATCTDVALTQDGLGYVCDREVGNIYQVDEITGPTLFTSSPDLEAAIVGQNALVVLPDQSALLSLLYLPSGISRVDLGDGSVLPVDITGKFSDLTPLHGADGMILSGGSAYVAFTSELIKVTPTLADWSTATSIKVDLPSGMTDVVSTPNGLYLLNGQSLTFALGTTPDPFQLVRFTGSL
jgi:sugar lactone lactonase YvrE